MSCWERLGINPTTDQALIRKAFSEQTNLHHPEEDPDGYALLRTALKQALFFAEISSHAKNAPLHESIQFPLQPTEAADINPADKEPQDLYKLFESLESSYEAHQKKAEQKRNAFLQKLEPLYDSQQGKQTLAQWKQVFHGQQFLELQTDPLFVTQFLDQMHSLISDKIYISAYIAAFLPMLRQWREKLKDDHPASEQLVANALRLHNGNCQRVQYLQKKKQPSFPVLIPFICGSVIFFALFAEATKNNRNSPSSPPPTFDYSNLTPPDYDFSEHIQEVAFDNFWKTESGKVFLEQMLLTHEKGSEEYEYYKEIYDRYYNNS